MEVSVHLKVYDKTCQNLTKNIPCIYEVKKNKIKNIN